MLKNKIHNTNPMLAHAPGDPDYSHWWNKIYDIRIPRCKPIDHLSIFTWNSKNPQPNKDMGIFESCLESAGYEHEVLRHEGCWNTNRIKIQMTIEHLMKVKTPYVLAADSSDVVILSSLDGIVEKFLDKKCDILFNAEIRFWPYDQMEDVKKFEDSIMSNGPFRYLNAGVWIGKTEGCLDFFKKCKNHIAWEPHPYSEQVCVKKTHVELHPKSMIDWSCSLFQNLNLATSEHLDL